MNLKFRYHSLMYPILQHFLQLHGPNTTGNLLFIENNELTCVIKKRFIIIEDDSLAENCILILRVYYFRISGFVKFLV